MVHRHPTLYTILGLVFLGITMALVFLSGASAWPWLTRTTLFLLSPFSLLLTLSYFHLSMQEERGF
jgi:hypothetical protein